MCLYNDGIPYKNTPYAMQKGIYDIVMMGFILVKSNLHSKPLEHEVTLGIHRMQFTFTIGTDK